MSSLPLSVSLNVSVCVCVYLSRFKLDISISIELIVDTTSVKLNIKRSSHHYIKHCAALFTPHDIIKSIVKHALHLQVNTISVINSVWTIVYAIKNAHSRVYIAIDIGKQIKVIIVYRERERYRHVFNVFTI